MWEKRYQICEPYRDDHNKRWYSEDNMQRLMKIGLLNQRGHKISSLAKLSYGELDLLYGEACEYGESGCCFVDRMTLSLQGTHEILLTQLLAKQLDKGSLEEFYHHAYKPMCDRMDFLFVSNAITASQMNLFHRTVRELLCARRLTSILSVSSCAPAVLIAYSEENRPMEATFLAAALAEEGIPSLRIGTSKDKVGKAIEDVTSRHPVFMVCLHDMLAGNSAEKSTDYAIFSTARVSDEQSTWVDVLNQSLRMQENKTQCFNRQDETITFVAT